MAIVCKSCNKDLYKDDGSGPYSCPSCIHRKIDAVDSTTGELVELTVGKGRKSVAPKSRDAIHLDLMKKARFGVSVPERPEPVKMLRLKSRQFRSTTVPLGPVYVRFDENGVGEVEEHNKQFIDPILLARPGRFEWLESATDNFVDTMLSLAAIRPSVTVKKEEVVEQEVEIPVEVEELKVASPPKSKKSKKAAKKDDEE